jgi:hypothetical protein
VSKSLSPLDPTEIIFLSSSRRGLALSHGDVTTMGVESSNISILRFGMHAGSREEHLLAWWTDIEEMKVAMQTLLGHCGY